MGKVSKSMCLLLVVMLAAVSLLAIQPTYAQSIPEPSTPQFTAKVVNVSDVPANYWISPGEVREQNMTVPSVYTVNYVIELIIKNQPFTSYVFNDTARALNGDYIERNVSLFYNIRMKEPSWENWTVFYDAGLRYPYASKLENTVLLLPIGNIPVGGENNTIYPVILRPFWAENGFAATESAPYGGQLDFQVEAMIGYVSRTIQFNSWHFTGETSDWSDTQTITIPAANSSPAPSPTIPELAWLALLLLCLILTSFALVLKRHRKI